MKAREFKLNIVTIIALLMIGSIRQAQAASLASFKDFSIALYDVEREEKITLLHLAITKTSEPSKSPFTHPYPRTPSVQITLVDDHGNEYSGWVDDHGNKYSSWFGIDLNYTENVPIINVLPKGFTYVDKVKISIPKIAPIEKIKIGDKETLFKKVKLVKPQLLKDFGASGVSKGQKVTVGKWLSFTMKEIFLASDGWKLSMAIENKEYNPLTAGVVVGVQHNDGTIYWRRVHEIKIPALSETSINRSLPTPTWVDEKKGIYVVAEPGSIVPFKQKEGKITPAWVDEKPSQPRALLLVYINISAKERVLKIFPLTPRELPTKCAYPNRVIHTIPLKGTGFHVGPFGIAITPDGKYVYVTSGDSVLVIKTSDNTVVDKIPVGNKVHEITITPDGKYVYVSSWTSGVLSIIKTSDNAVVDKIRLVESWDAITQGIANGIAITPDGKYVYVATWHTWSTGNIWVLQTSDNTIVDKISVEMWPFGITIAPNGEYVYVASSKNHVWVIRTSDNTVVDKIPVADHLHGIAVSPEGNYVYATSWSYVQIIKTSDNTVVDKIPHATYAGTALRGIAVTLNGKYIYLTNPRYPLNVTEVVEDRPVEKTAYCVTVIRTLDNTLVDKIPVGKEPHGIAIAPDGKYVYVTNPGDHTVSVVGFK